MYDQELLDMFCFFRDCLAFATEPIFASLANLLGKHDNMPSPPPPDFKVCQLIITATFVMNNNVLSWSVQ